MLETVAVAGRGRGDASGVMMGNAGYTSACVRGRLGKMCSRGTGGARKGPAALRSRAVQVQTATRQRRHWHVPAPPWQTRKYRRSKRAALSRASRRPFPLPQGVGEQSARAPVCALDIRPLARGASGRCTSANSSTPSLTSLALTPTSNVLALYNLSSAAASAIVVTCSVCLEFLPL